MTVKSVLFIVYALLDPRTNEIRYIGRTNNIKNRFAAHINRAKNLKKALNNNNEHLYNWINILLDLDLKPIIKILESDIIEDNINEKEIYWIKYYRNKTNLVNQNDGGKGFGLNNKVWVGKKHSEQTKKKISAGNKGKIISKELIEKLRNLNKGRTFSEETKKKISKSVLNSFTQEVRYKMGASFRGKFLSEEHKKKIGLGNKGKVVSQETKDKLSKLNKGKKYSLERIERMSSLAPTHLEVEQYSLDGIFIQSFISIRRIPKQLGISINRTKIRLCCEGKLASYKDFIWKFSKGENKNG